MYDKKMLPRTGCIFCGYQRAGGKISGLSTLSHTCQTVALSLSLSLSLSLYPLSPPLSVLSFAKVCLRGDFFAGGLGLPGTPDQQLKVQTHGSYSVAASQGQSGIKPCVAALSFEIRPNATTAAIHSGIVQDAVTFLRARLQGARCLLIHYSTDIREERKKELENESASVVVQTTSAAAATTTPIHSLSLSLSEGKQRAGIDRKEEEETFL